MKERKPWVYKGHTVWPADMNSSGIRWYTLNDGETLRSDTKAGMRQLITEAERKKINGR